MRKIGLSAVPACWQATILLSIGEAVNYADRAAMSATFPALRSALGLSDVALGLLGSVFLWSYAIGSPLAGAFSDRHSRNGIVMGSLAAWSAITLLTGFANGVVVFCALRIGLGLAESLYIPASIALIGDHHTARTRARGLSLLNIGSGLGVVGGGSIAGLIAVGLGWRPVFWLLGAGGLLVALVFAGFLPRAPTTRRSGEGKPGMRETLSYLSRVPSFYFLLSKVMLYGVALWIFFTWLPMYFHDTYQMNLASAGFAGTFLTEFPPLLGLGLGAWLSDMVAARAIRKRILLQGICSLLAAPFLLMFFTRPRLWAVTAALCLFGFFCGLGDANEQSILCEIVPSRFRSTAAGLMNTCATAAGGVGVLLAGLEKQSVGLNVVFGVSAALFVAAALGLLAAYRLFVTTDIARASEYRGPEGPETLYGPRLERP